MTEPLRRPYLESMRAHCDEGGQLNNRNGLDLLAEVERLLSIIDDADKACVELAAKHSYATGHGDTVGDMVREFSAQIPAVKP